MSITLSEKIGYMERNQRRYRIKTRGTVVSIERQAGMGTYAAPEQAFNLGTFPVLDDRYWDMDIIDRLIQWYESEQNDITDAFRIPSPDQAPTFDPNACMIMPKPYIGIENYPPEHPGHARLLSAIMNERPLPEGGYDICGCGRYAELNGNGQCADCAPQDEIITGAPDDPLVGAVGPEYEGD